MDKRGRFDRGEIDASGQEQAPRQSYREHAEADGGRRYGRAGPTGRTGPASGGWSEDDLSDIFGDIFRARQQQSDNAPMRGQDEHYMLTVSFLDAVLGATPRLTLPDGRTLDVKIPPGATTAACCACVARAEPGGMTGRLATR